MQIKGQKQEEENKAQYFGFYWAGPHCKCFASIHLFGSHNLPEWYHSYSHWPHREDRNQLRATRGSVTGLLTSSSTSPEGTPQK